MSYYRQLPQIPGFSPVTQSYYKAPSARTLRPKLRLGTMLNSSKTNANVRTKPKKCWLKNWEETRRHLIYRKGADGHAAFHISTYRRRAWLTVFVSTGIVNSFFRDTPHTCRCSCGIPHSHPQFPASALGRSGPYNGRRGLYGCKSPPLLCFASYVLVIPLGFEPKTHSLEGCCSNPTELRDHHEVKCKGSDFDNDNQIFTCISSYIHRREGLPAPWP